MEMLEKLSLAGIVPVIKVEDAADAVPLCKALSDGGLPVAEITFRSDAAEEAIRRVHEELPEVILGAGTVLTKDQVDRSINAGATYIVSPGLNPEIVKCSDAYSTEEGCLSLSGIRKTKRYQSIKIRYQNADFAVRLKTFTGWTAQIIQHEIDHCNGILI